METNVEEEVSLVQTSKEEIEPTEIDAELEETQPQIESAKPDTSGNIKTPSVDTTGDGTTKKTAKSENPTEDNLSLEVLVDDTQNDLDSDLVHTTATAGKTDGSKNSSANEKVNINEAVEKIDTTVDDAKVKSLAGDSDKSKKKTEEGEESKGAIKRLVWFGLYTTFVLILQVLNISRYVRKNG